MTNIINRIGMAWRCLFGPLVMVVDAIPQTPGKPHKITLWGTIDIPTTQIGILRALADSIEVDQVTTTQGTQPGSKTLLGQVPKMDNPPPPPQISANGKMRLLAMALQELVDLKDLKDREGKTADYLERQPKAWESARKILDQITPS